MPNRQTIRQTLAVATQAVEAAFAAEFVSLVHYGPTTEMDVDSANPGHEPIRLMLVLEDMSDASVLSRLAALDPESINVRQTDWLTLSQQELDRSTDVFPELFMEMKRRHQLVAGQDVLTALDIREHHLRLRCEQQFKQLLFELRRDLQIKPKDVHQRLADQLLRFGEICSGTLLLTGIDPPRDTSELFRKSAEILGLEWEQLSQIESQIHANRLLRKKSAEIQIGLIAMVRSASDFVDRMEDDVIEVEMEG